MDFVIPEVFLNLFSFELLHGTDVIEKHFQEIGDFLVFFELQIQILIQFVFFRYGILVFDVSKPISS